MLLHKFTRKETIDQNVLTQEDKQTHADGEDGAGAEGSQTVTSDLAQLTALTPEALLTPTPEVVC